MIKSAVQAVQLVRTHLTRSVGARIVIRSFEFDRASCAPATFVSCKKCVRPLSCTVCMGCFNDSAALTYIAK
jgi:hypothetical protein